MIKIGYIIPNIEIGGTEKHLLSLIKNIDKNIFSTLLITTAGGGSLYEKFKRITPVFILGGQKDKARKKPPLNPLIHLKTIFDISKILKNEKVDIVHCYLPAANSLGPISAKLAGIPIIITSKRSLANYKIKHPIISKLENIGNLLSTTILVNSIAVKKEIERTESFYNKKIEVIYNGITIPDIGNENEKKEIRRKYNIKENSILALCVSNFFKYKGHEELVKAINIIKDEIPKIEYLFIGRDAGNFEYIKKLISELNLNKIIHLIEETDNISDFFKISDFFIHPSREEGFSNAILEAMSYSLPVIACDTGGNPEAVENLITGLIVPKENPIALAEAIKKMIKNPEQIRKMGQKARERAINYFSIEKMVKNIEDLYKKLYTKQ